jgi:hypothetical protein
LIMRIESQEPRIKKIASKSEGIYYKGSISAE